MILQENMIWLEEFQYNSSKNIKESLKRDSLYNGQLYQWLDGDADNIEVTGSSPVLPTN